MKKALIAAFTFCLTFSFSLPTVALAQGPAPTPDLPYHFEPLEIGPPEHEIPINFTTPEFINDVGSYALTLFTLLDQYNVLGIFVVIMVGLSALWWLYSFVTDRPIIPTLNISGGLDVADDVADHYYDDLYRKAESYYENDPMGRERDFGRIKEERDHFKSRSRLAKKIIRYF
jgi:hypothetical protein